MENDDTLLPSYNRKKGIYGCFACGIGVYLAVHKDKDIFYSAVTTHIHPNEGKEDGEIHYKRDSPILSYFVFPDLGYACGCIQLCKTPTCPKYKYQAQEMLQCCTVYKDKSGKFEQQRYSVENVSCGDGKNTRS